MPHYVPDEEGGGEAADYAAARAETFGSPELLSGSG